MLGEVLARPRGVAVVRGARPSCPVRSWRRPGAKADVYQLLLVNFHIGVAQAGDTERRPIHSSYFAVVDQRARVRGHYEGTDRVALKRLRGDLERLLPDGRLAPVKSRPPGPAPRNEGDS